MLRFFKHISCSQAAFPLNSKLIYNTQLRLLSRIKSRRETVAVVEARERARHSRTEANARIIEELYFPDHSQMKIQEYIQEKRELLGEGEGAVHEKVELNEQDLKYIQDMSSQGTNVTGMEKSFRFPESQEEMSKLIAHTDINDKLLKFYMKHHRQAGKIQIFELLNKLEENLANERTVREREEERYRKKVRALQKINKDIEVMFTAIFLTKEETVKHPGFKFLVNNINFKAREKIYQPYTVLELYHSLLKFDPRAFELIDKEVVNKFEGELNDHKIYTLAKYLNLLNHYKKDKETRRLVGLTYKALVQKDFREITKYELLSLLIPIKKIGLFADAELMYKLEPYILKYIKEIDANNLADIFLTYLQFRCGSAQFMQFLMTTLQLNVKRMNIGYLKTLLTLSNRQYTGRKDLSFDDLRQGAAHELMKKFKFWNYGIKELREVLKTFVGDGLGNENYYDMISVEFMKKKDNLNSQEFMNIYYLLALADLNSQSLAYGCNKQIIECIDEIQASDRETVAGLLGTREPEKPAGTLNDILPVDLKLNYYEKKYAAKFKQLMRTMWAYSFFIVRKQQWTHFNMDMWNQGIKQLNNMIAKLKKFTGLMDISRTDVELLHQINLFARIHGKNSFTVNLKEFNEVKLLYKGAARLFSLTFKTHLFAIEKNYFLKKYQAFITRHKEIGDYQFEVTLENKANNTVTNIFINDVYEYLGLYENEALRGKGHLRLRDHYLKESNTPFISINFDQFSKDLPNVKNMKEGYLEQMLKKHIELPETSGSLDETEAATVQKLWSKIKTLRSKIPETSLTFEEGLKEVFDKEIMGQAATDVVFDEQVEEEEDVYRDSDSDSEEQQQQQQQSIE